MGFLRLVRKSASNTPPIPNSFSINIIVVVCSPHQTTSYPPLRSHILTMELASMSRMVARRVAQRTPSVRYYSIVHDVPRTTAALGQTPPPPQQDGRSVFNQAVNATGPRNNWTKDEISQIHHTPLMELAFAAVSQLAWALGQHSHNF